MFEPAEPDHRSPRHIDVGHQVARRKLGRDERIEEVRGKGLEVNSSSFSMCRLHTDAFEASAQARREPERGGEAGVADRLARRRNRSAGRRHHPQPEVCRIRRIDPPTTSRVRRVQAYLRSLVNAGEHPAAGKHCESGVGVPHRNVDADLQPCFGRTGPFSGYSVGSSPQGETGGRWRKSRTKIFEFQQTTPDDRSAVQCVGAKARRQVSCCLIGIDECIDQQPPPNVSNDLAPVP